MENNDFVNVYIEKLNERVVDLTKEGLITSTKMAFYDKQLLAYQQQVDYLQAQLNSATVENAAQAEDLRVELEGTRIEASERSLSDKNHIEELTHLLDAERTRTYNIKNQLESDIINISGRLRDLESEKTHLDMKVYELVAENTNLKNELEAALTEIRSRITTKATSLEEELTKVAVVEDDFTPAKVSAPVPKSNKTIFSKKK